MAVALMPASRGPFWLALLAAALGAACVAACGTATATPANTRMVPVPIGYTQCHTTPEGRQIPISWVRADMVGTPDQDQIMAHEQAHRAVMQAFASCDDYAAWRDLLVNKIQEEAVAMCASARADVEGGRWLIEQARRIYATTLSNGYPYGLTPDQAESIMRLVC